MAKPPVNRPKPLPHLRDFKYAVAQYQSTDRTVQELSDEIGVTRSELFDYFSTNGITRGVPTLSKSIGDRTTEILAGDVIDATSGVPTTREQIVEINATLQAALIREHREDINRFRKLAMILLNELEGMTSYNDVLEDLGHILRSEDKNGVDKLNDAYHKVISLPGRTDTLKKLGETLKIVIQLERQAFGMRDDYEDDEIRKARQAGTTPVQQAVESDFAAIASTFNKILLSHQTKAVADA